MGLRITYETECDCCGALYGKEEMHISMFPDYVLPKPKAHIWGSLTLCHRCAYSVDDFLKKRFHDQRTGPTAGLQAKEAPRVVSVAESGIQLKLFRADAGSARDDPRSDGGVDPTGRDPC